MDGERRQQAEKEEEPTDDCTPQTLGPFSSLVSKPTVQIA